MLVRVKYSTKVSSAGCAPKDTRRRHYAAPRFQPWRTPLLRHSSHPPADSPYSYFQPPLPISSTCPPLPTYKSRELVSPEAFQLLPHTFFAKPHLSLSRLDPSSCCALSAGQDVAAVCTDEKCEPVQVSSRISPPGSVRCVLVQLLIHELSRSDGELAINIRKATTIEETAPKRKHVRSCIVYTWDHKSSGSFWAGMKVYVSHPGCYVT